MIIFKLESHRIRFVSGQNRWEVSTASVLHMFPENWRKAQEFLAKNRKCNSWINTYKHYYIASHIIRDRILFSKYWIHWANAVTFFSTTSPPLIWFRLDKMILCNLWIVIYLKHFTSHNLLFCSFKKLCQYRE